MSDINDILRRLSTLEKTLDKLQNTMETLITKINCYSTEIALMKQRHHDCPARIATDKKEDLKYKMEEQKFRVIDIVLVIMSLVIAIAVFIK